MVTFQNMTTADLWRLQETDVAIDSRSASLADAEARLGPSDEAVAARERADALQNALRESQVVQKDLELQADDLRAKIGPQETKLYGGAIKNPKELADLQADIDQLKRHLSSIEDKDLEALAALESAQSEAQAARAEADALETAWNEEQRELTARIAVLAREIGEHEADRLERAAVIEPDVLKQYEHIRRAHQGRALAKLDRNLCTGCRISLPTNVVNRARAGNALVQCPNCERILHA